jgi:hypothetical protein
MPRSVIARLKCNRQGRLFAVQRRPPCRPERPLDNAQQSWGRKGPMQIAGPPLIAAKRAAVPDPNLTATVLQTRR